MELGVFVLAHKRPQLLELICEQIHAISRTATIQISLDRPTAGVLSAAQRCRGAGVHYIPFPVVDDVGEHYMAARQWQLEQLTKACTPDYIALWDDDHILEDPDEAREVLECGEADLIYATKVFLWNSLTSENSKIPTHCSPLFFRHLPGDAYPASERKMIHAPECVHDQPSAKKVMLRGRLMDIGYLTVSERCRVATEYFRAGKIDAATMAVVDDPALRPFTSDSIWYRKLKDVFKT